MSPVTRRFFVRRCKLIPAHRRHHRPQPRSGRQTVKQTTNLWKSSWRRSLPPKPSKSPPPEKRARIGVPLGGQPPNSNASVADCWYKPRHPPPQPRRFESRLQTPTDRARMERPDVCLERRKIRQINAIVFSKGGQTYGIGAGQ